MFPGASSASLTAFLSQVLEWNPHLGVVSRKDPLSACERLLMESLELGQLLHAEGVARVADVGSGAGFPGVVWAIAHPLMEVVLVERREKRALFLDRLCRTLPLARASVIDQDIRDTGTHQAFQSPFDLIVTMAVGDLEEIGEVVARFIGAGGRFASTISRETSAPERIGNQLELEKRVDGKFGCYAIYRHGV